MRAARLLQWGREVRGSRCHVLVIRKLLALAILQHGQATKFSQINSLKSISVSLAGLAGKSKSGTTPIIGREFPKSKQIGLAASLALTRALLREMVQACYEN